MGKPYEVITYVGSGVGLGIERRYATQSVLDVSFRGLKPHGYLRWSLRDHASRSSDA